MKVVLFHKNCNDGLFAAYACWLKFKNTAIYIPVNYKPIQDLSTQEALDYIFNHDNADKIDGLGNSKYSLKDITPSNYHEIDLYVVDYSFPVKQFKEHCDLFKSVTVLDHHDNAIKAYSTEFIYEYDGYTQRKYFHIRDHCNVIFSSKESGALLTYKYFFPKEIVPDYFELVSDRDLWKFEYTHSKAFHSGAMLLGIENFNKLDLNLKHGLERILDLGTVYENELTNRINKIKRSGLTDVTIRVNGSDYRVGIVNSYLDIASDLCSSILSDGYQMAMVYSIGVDGDVSVSVRSIKDIDGSVISLHYGGGGHKQASGFHTTMEFLSNLLSTKYLEVNCD
jgi:oligoribonuclease NrnB/cAMP/cGMP phosphodiesterase (DHH superfamily)